MRKATAFVLGSTCWFGSLAAHAQVAAGPPPPPPPPGVPGAPPDALEYDLKQNPILLGVSTGVDFLSGGLGGTAYELMAHLGNSQAAFSIGVMNGDLTIDDTASLTGTMRVNKGYKFAIGLDLLRGPARLVVYQPAFQGFLLYPCAEVRTAVNGDGFLAMGTVALTGGRIALPSGMRVDVRVPAVTGWFAPVEEPDKTLDPGLGYSWGAQIEIGTSSW